MSLKAQFSRIQFTLETFLSHNLLALFKYIQGVRKIRNTFGYIVPFSVASFQYCQPYWIRHIGIYLIFIK